MTAPEDSLHQDAPAENGATLETSAPEEVPTRPSVANDDHNVTNTDDHNATNTDDQNVTNTDDYNATHAGDRVDDPAINVTPSSDDFELLNPDGDADGQDSLQRSSGSGIETGSSEVLSASFFPKPKKNGSVRTSSTDFVFFAAAVQLLIMTRVARFFLVPT
jgi:hypothetical protein